MSEPLTVTVDHPERAQEVTDQLADLFATELAKSLIVTPEPLKQTSENVTAFLMTLSTGHEIKAHPITEEDRRLHRIRYTITESPQSQRVAVTITTENS